MHNNNNNKRINDAQKDFFFSCKNDIFFFQPHECLFLSPNLSAAVIDASKCVAPRGRRGIIRCNLCVKCHASIPNVLQQFRNALTLFKFVSHIKSIRPVRLCL